MIIYKAENKINGKIYIGQTTKSLNIRKVRHRYSSSGIFRYAVKKYGLGGFDWQILETCTSKYDLDLAEEWYIRKFNSRHPNGYNITIGGGGCLGYKHDKNTLNRMRKYMMGKNIGKVRDNAFKKKLSNIFSGSGNPMHGKTGEAAPNYGRKFSDTTRGKMSANQTGDKNSFYGRKHTDKTRECMSESRKGKKHPLFGKNVSATTKHKISVANSKKYTITFPDGSKEVICGIVRFCKENNLDSKSMINCAKGRTKSHKGYRCSYYADGGDK